MGGIIDVDTHVMRAHAQHVTAMVSQAEQAVDAARQVSFHPKIYGDIGAALVYPLLAPLEVAGVSATAAVVASLADTAAGVTTAAAAFDTVDEAVHHVMRSIKGHL